MIKVNLNDGKVLSFDLNKESDFSTWNQLSETLDFQKKITGIGILHEKKFHTLQYPRNFKKIRIYAEVILGGEKTVGERVTIHADHIKLELLVYSPLNSPVQTRTTMTLIGKQMFLNDSFRQGQSV